MTHPSDRDTSGLQRRVDAWTTDNIDVMVEHSVATISASPAADRMDIVVTLIDGSFARLSTLLIDDDRLLDLALREAVRQATILRGLGPALDGVDLSTIAPEEMAARIEHYLTANPLVRWQRTREYVARELQSLHLRTAGALSTVGARWMRLEDESESRVIHGLLCASPEGDSVFHVAAVFPSRAQVEAGADSGYRLMMACDPTAPSQLHLLLVEASKGPPARQLEDVIPRLEAMAGAVIVYFGSAHPT